jgi:hypothetical protein
LIYLLTVLQQLGEIPQIVGHTYDTCDVSGAKLVFYSFENEIHISEEA